jgi:anionic cell wall polymer biosynthesis LytR-Cps2A-Psr (LCP) family protein
MKKKAIVIILILIIFGLGAWFFGQKIFLNKAEAAQRKTEQALKKAREDEINSAVNSRRAENAGKDNVDVFGADNQVKILLIGLDKRAGKNEGHCDVIQLVTIDRKTSIVTITAVPRGTYSPLPRGKGATSSDYYVSNACGLGGLDYGVKQIEKILGQKADYLVVVGFSETLGILRSLKLPTTETLQWLRERQAYAIGEPQRAHNHSTFIKQMMIKFLGGKNSQPNKALQYVIYKIVKTDLSFLQTQAVVGVLAEMKLADHPDNIKLAMRPAYGVQDIPYVSENLSEYLDKTVGRVKNQLSKDDYSGASQAETETKLLKLIGEKIGDKDFVAWSYENNLWLQIEDSQKRLAIQFDILNKYLPQLATSTIRQSIIADYILEMENYGEDSWAEKGKEILKAELGL